MLEIHAVQLQCTVVYHSNSIYTVFFLTPGGFATRTRRRPDPE